MADTVARQVLWPNDDKILVRVAFLYVGQGACAIVFMKDPTGYKVLVVDINLDRKNGGIDVPRLTQHDQPGLRRGLRADARGKSHDHPCDFAMEKYEDQCGDENVFHTGEDRYSYIFDIYDDGYAQRPDVRRGEAGRGIWPRRRGR